MNFDDVLNADKSQKESIESEADVRDLDEQHPITVYEKEQKNYRGSYYFTSYEKEVTSRRFQDDSSNVEDLGSIGHPFIMKNYTTTKKLSPRTENHSVIHNEGKL